MTKQDYQKAVRCFEPNPSLKDRVAAAEEQGCRRHMSVHLRTAVIAACVCAALLGTAFAAEAIWGVRIADFVGSGEDVGYKVLLDGVEAVPVDGLPEELLAASWSEPIDFDTMEEVETALGMELPGFSPFEEGAYRDELHFRITVGENEGPMHHTHCTLWTNGPEGNPSIIGVTAAYRTYPPQAAISLDNAIYLDVTAYLYTESGLTRHSEQLGMLFKDSELTLGSFTTPDGQEIPIISATYPVTVNDENDMPVDTREDDSVYAYFICNGVLYSVEANGVPTVDKEELQPALERILGVVGD